MTICALVLTLITCTLAQDPPRDAAEAARILSPYQFVAPERHRPFVVIAGSPTAGPFGEFKEFSEPRRLDGSLLSDPPWQTLPAPFYGYLPYDQNLQFVEQPRIVFGDRPLRHRPQLARERR